jgi:hypothetical protein
MACGSSTRCSNASSIRRSGPRCARLTGLIDPKTDSLRFYLLGSSRHKVEHIGTRLPTDLEEPLIL